MTASEETWAAIRRDWQETIDRPGLIARRHNLHVLVICTRARRESWPRPEGAPLLGVNKRSKPRRLLTQNPGAEQTRQARDALIGRLYAAIAAKLTQLEERMNKTEQPEQDESERQTRELGSMIQGFEKVTEVAAVAAKSDAITRANIPLTTTADIERVRRELAQRLFRLWGKVEPAALPGPAAGNVAARPDDRGD